MSTNEIPPLVAQMPHAMVDPEPDANAWAVWTTRSGLPHSPGQFRKLVRVVAQRGGDETADGRPVGVAAG